MSTVCKDLKYHMCTCDVEQKSITTGKTKMRNKNAVTNKTLKTLSNTPENNAGSLGVRTPTTNSTNIKISVFMNCPLSN